MQKITYSWKSMSFLEMLMTLIPFKSKKYVLKWLAYRGTWADAVYVEHACDGIQISLHTKDHVVTGMPNPIISHGMSFVTAWEEMLKMIACLENMSNAEELCIWLDLYAAQHS